ncbi:MAG: hypothetical protein KDI22_09655, partial [Gammaproteobacteria bacterium]|nr:hypothetical protein [Gammaproteobacteria bacterium]
MQGIEQGLERLAGKKSGVVHGSRYAAMHRYQLSSAIPHGQGVGVQSLTQVGYCCDKRLKRAPEVAGMLAGRGSGATEADAA